MKVNNQQQEFLEKMHSNQKEIEDLQKEYDSKFK